MARRRMLDPSFWDDTRIGRLTFRERLFFLGCVSKADDEGRLIGDVAYLRAEIFKYDDLGLEEVEAMRDKVVDAIRKFVLYRVDGEEYLAFVNWSDYQKPSHARASMLPPPPLENEDGERMESRAREDGEPREARTGRLGKDSIGKDSVGKSGKATSRKRDPCLDHKAIIGYKELVRLHIPIPLRDDWIACAEEVGTEHLLAIVKEWLGKGHNKQNVVGIMDVAKNGWKYGTHKQPDDDPLGFNAAAKRRQAEGR